MTALAGDRQAISLRRAITVVAVSIGIALAVRLLVNLGAYGAATAASAASPGSWAGVGVALLGAAGGLILGYVVAVVGVAIGMRRRVNARRFVGVFAALLGLIVVVPIVVYQWGGLTLLPSFDGSPLSISYLVTVPLLVVIPAAVVGALGWRHVGIVAAGGLALALIVSGIFSIGDNTEQQKWNAAFEGPTYVPSTSPESPLAGYTLRGVQLLNGYNTDHVDLSYINREGDSESYYDLHFLTGIEQNFCTEETESCTLIGEALGAPVYESSVLGTFYVIVDKGTVSLQGYIDPEDALVVLRDLTPATIDDIAALTVRD